MFSFEIKATHLLSHKLNGELYESFTKIIFVNANLQEKQDSTNLERNKTGKFHSLMVHKGCIVLCVQLKQTVNF